MAEEKTKEHYMQEKKVATSIDILINVGQFEHIQITKYAEKKITYESSEEMVKKEDEVTSELASDIIRTMRALPDKLGKKTNAVELIEEKIQKRIPDWLANNPIPNLAKDKFVENQAKANVEIVVKKEKEEKENREVANLVELPSELPIEKLVEKPVEKPSEKPLELKSDDLFDDEDLFK